jgi:hypothetical protein
LLVAACSGSEAEPATVDTDGGAGAAGGAGSAGAAGAAGAGDPCKVEASTPGPYHTQFRFVNHGESPVWLKETCEFEFSLLSCEDGYTKEVARSSRCTASCEDMADGGGCVLCEACDQGALMLAGSATAVSSEWTGHAYTLQQATGCQCHVANVAPAGKYRVRISVWDQQFDPHGTVPPASRVVEKDFELPTATGQVMIPVEK